MTTPTITDADRERADALSKMLDVDGYDEYFIKQFAAHREAAVAAERERHAAEAKAQRIATTKAAAKWLRERKSDQELWRGWKAEDEYEKRIILEVIECLADELDAMDDGLPG